MEKYEFKSIYLEKDCGGKLGHFHRAIYQARQKEWQVVSYQPTGENLWKKIISGEISKKSVFVLLKRQKGKPLPRLARKRQLLKR